MAQLLVGLWQDGRGDTAGLSPRSQVPLVRSVSEETELQENNKFALKPLKRGAMQLQRAHYLPFLIKAQVPSPAMAHQVY